MVLGSPASRPENVKTELGAIAVCIASMVAFLSVSAWSRPLFAVSYEWWGFLLGGVVWLTIVAQRMMKLHIERMEMANHLLIAENQGKTVDRYRTQVELQLKTLEVLNANMLALSSVQQPNAEEGHGKNQTPNPCVG